MSIYSVVIKLYRSNRIEVIITTIPNDSAVTIDGNKITSSKIYLKPGSYKFTAKKQDYSDDEQTVDVNQDNNKVFLTPQPLTSEAKEWYQNNVDDTTLEYITGERIDMAREELTKKIPIINHLPKIDVAGPFKIEYKTDKNNTPYVEINHSTPDGRIKALGWIKSTGIDPTTLDIRFGADEFVNPLTNKDY